MYSNYINLKTSRMDFKYQIPSTSVEHHWIAPDMEQGPRGTIYFEWFVLIVTSDALRMGTETVPEMSASFSLLIQLIAQEDFINSCRHESFKSYIC
jgi:hypothetical protein